MNRDDYDDKVGYGRPPRHSRFKPGQSGNPRGRPRGARNLKTEIEEEMNERITLRENGRELKVSKRRAIIKAMVGKTLKGDVRAANTLISTMLRLTESSEAIVEPDDLSAEDEAIIARFRERTSEIAGCETEDPAPPATEPSGSIDDDL
jgi:hypothetical protein